MIDSAGVEFPMITDFLAWLLATFVIDPVHAEITSKLQAAQVPAEIAQQIQACVMNGTPALLERASNDMWWGISTSISVAVGLSDAQSVLAATSPDCAAAVAAVTPFLAGPEA
jgi:hypothetical protein